MENFSERLVSIRKSKKISQKDFANAIGVSPTAVNLWEKGKTQPSIEMIQKIVTFFNISYNELYGWEKYQLSILKSTKFQELIELLGYTIQVEKTKISENLEESFSIILEKDGIKTIFDNNEFNHFQESIEKSIEFEIFKRNQL